MSKQLDLLWYHANKETSHFACYVVWSHIELCQIYQSCLNAPCTKTVVVVVTVALRASRGYY